MDIKPCSDCNSETGDLYANVDMSSEQLHIVVKYCIGPERTGRARNTVRGRLV